MSKKTNETKFCTSSFQHILFIRLFNESFSQDDFLSEYVNCHFFHSSLLNSTDKIGMLMIWSSISHLPSEERATGVNRGEHFFLVFNSFNIYWRLGPHFNSKAYVRVSIKVKMKWAGYLPYATGFSISQRISSNNRTAMRSLLLVNSPTFSR